MMCKERETQHRLVFPRRAMALGWPLENSEWPETSTVLGKGEDRWGSPGYRRTLLCSYLTFLWRALVASSKNDRKPLMHATRKGQLYLRKAGREEKRLRSDGWVPFSAKITMDNKLQKARTAFTDWWAVRTNTSVLEFIYFLLSVVFQQGAIFANIE